MKLIPQDRLVIEGLRRDTKVKKIYIRYTILLMLDDGLTYEEVGRYLGISEKTVQRVVDLMTESGIDGISILHYQGRSSFLDVSQTKLLRRELKANLYKDTNEIQAWLANKFEIRMSRSAINTLLKRMGFVYKKTKIQPGKADAVEQRQVAMRIKRLKKQLKDTETLYFIDGTHPTYNTRSGYGWIEKGKEYAMPSNTGRQRVNINGAMNGCDPTEVHVDFAEMINAQRTIRVLKKIAAKNRNKKKIYIIGDNARYYCSRELKAWLKEHPQFKWMPLPAYSPNLNLIERLWGFMKRERLENFYFDTYQKFRAALSGFFKDLKQYKSALQSLITYNFQIIEWN